jgi:hypothetical protein
VTQYGTGDAHTGDAPIWLGTLSWGSESAIAEKKCSLVPQMDMSSRPDTKLGSMFTYAFITKRACDQPAWRGMSASRALRASHPAAASEPFHRAIEGITDRMVPAHR